MKIDITFYCKAEARIKAIEYLNGVVLKELENGDMMPKLHLPRNEQLWFGTLLSFENLAEVIEPLELKKTMCEKASKILRLYHDT